jgi:hypothetical protein
MMFASPAHSLKTSVRISTFVIVVISALLGASAAFGQAQSNAADLQGFVRDPSGAVVANATVTARNPATNTSKTAASNDEGYYQILNLTPGEYEVSVEAPNFKKAVLPGVKLTVGQRADLDVSLEVGQVSEVVTISGATAELVETSKTAISTTIDQQRIDNLPINERNYLSFALTTSTVGRDNGRPIGPAPTTGLNFGGQRGRSNLVQVDGADNTDNSVNAARSTVSQEAVQEFQVVTNSFAPEFGRSAGGVVNVVTKSGANDLHGNVFGFLRDKRFQARNAFAPVAKPAFRRTQYGVTLGGPFDRDRTFFFFAFEQRRRDESGFFTSNVAQGLNASVTIPVIPAGPGIFLNPIARTFNNITTQQAAYINGLLAAGTGPAVCAARAYAFFASSGGTTGLTGTNPLFSPNDGSVCPAISPILPSTIGSRFILSGAPVPVGTTNAAGQFIAFRPLNDLVRIFPVTERTTFNSVRLDHLITKDHQLSFRFGYNPSRITGIQSESQNQAIGQNDFSRTGIQRLRDFSLVTSLTSTLSSSMVNELRFNFGERRATFHSQNLDAVAVNISGAAFFGRELFSPVIRTETRYEWTDSLNVVKGNHNFKFGGDVAFIHVNAIFELNFAGVYNFGGQSAAPLGFPGAPPDFTPVQQYGLGVPSNYVQGFGNPASNLGNRPYAAFAQDSWKIRPNFTLNYGVRYDYEQTQQIAPSPFTDPLSHIALTAADNLNVQDFFNVQQGFPRDKNNFAPRIGMAWDLKNDGRTVLRAAYGIFYDHPLLAIGFNSDIADNVQQQQFVAVPGLPDPRNNLNAAQIFQGTVCVPGQVCPFGPFVTPGVAVGTDYQRGRQRFNDQTFPGFGPALPFPLPVSKDFQFAYANQANVSVERKLTDNMSLTASWIFVGAHHLPHPTNLNPVNNALLIQNYVRCNGTQPTNAGDTLAVDPTLCANIVAQPIPGFISITTRGAVVRPFAVNLFRRSGPNYFFVQSASGGAVTPAVFNGALLATGALARPGIISTYGDVNAQVSDGNSLYNAASFDLKRRFANNFQFLASYTWSHSIDDSSDLQTLLLPQDASNLAAERADSLFDQRHRFVFSGVLASPVAWRGAGGWHSFLSDFIVAPIFEISSGRPFNIVSGVDTNNDQTSQTDRPSVLANGTLIIPPAFTSGSLGRNAGITRSYSSFDMRVARKIRLGERFSLEAIAEGFNLFNRFNEASVSPRFDDINAFNKRAGNGRYFGRPTAAYDPRQFQFGLKLNF